MKPSGIFCRYLSIWFHWPIQNPAGGWKCERCGWPGLTQGELLGANDRIDYWRLSEASRQQLAGKAEPEPREAVIVPQKPATAAQARRILPGVFSRVAV